MKLVKQVEIFRDLVGEDEQDKQKRINEFLKNNDDIDVIENFVTNDGEVVVIIHYFIDISQKESTE